MPSDPANNKQNIDNTSKDKDSVQPPEEVAKVAATEQMNDAGGIAAPLQTNQQIPIATGNIFPTSGGVRREMTTVVASTNTKPERCVDVKYSNVRVVGNGSFGVVYVARLHESGEPVAIKKVLQDKRYKNRELQIMRKLEHQVSCFWYLEFNR